MTADDRGKAGLAEALRVTMHSRANEEDAAAILAALPPGGHDDAAGWPSGWRDTVTEYEAEITRLRAALDELTTEAEIIRAHPDRPMLPHPDTVTDARAALAPKLDDIHGTPTFSDPCKCGPICAACGRARTPVGPG